MLLVCNFLEMFLFIKLQELELQMEHFHLFCFWTNQNQTKPSHHHPSSHAVGKYKTCPLFWQNAGAVARVRTQERRGAGSQLLGPSSLQTAQPCVLAPSCKTKDRKLGELHMPSRGLLSRKDKNHLCGVCVLANS